MIFCSGIPVIKDNKQRDETKAKNFKRLNFEVLRFLIFSSYYLKSHANIKFG